MKKNIKRLIAVLLVMTMIISMCSTAFAAGHGGHGNKGSNRGQQKKWSKQVTQSDAASNVIIEDSAETATDNSQNVEENAEEAVEAASEETISEEPAEEAVAEETTTEETAISEETTEEEPAAVDEEEAVSVEETEETITYPAVSFDSEKVDGVIVHVDAPEGALPEGTTMDVAKVSLDAVQDAVDRADDITGTVVAAVDITFADKEGEVVEPKSDITVTMTSDEIAKVESPSVVHVDVKADEIKDADVAAEKVNDEKVTAEDDAVAFDAAKFSVYAVVEEGDTGSDARVAVNFISKDNTIATMYVKNSDTLEELNVILYDPGVGTLATGEKFLGWTLDENYSAESDRMTIDEVRNDMEKLPITEGMSEINFYAVIGKTITLTYLDDKNVAIESTSAELIGSASTAVIDVNASAPTIDSEHNFEGWRIKDGSSNIISAVDADGTLVKQPYSAETLFPNGSKLTMNGNVTLSMHAPAGHWLVFNENGKGATYNAPRFLEAGEKTEKPRPDSEMVRLGYSFGGWYTDAACTDGNEFTFGNTISENTNVYAKWTPNANANYTIIIWKQNIAATGYDFEESIQLTGTVGQDITTVKQQGTGNAAYARINDVNKQYEGFHLKEFDQNVKIVPEGNAVVNVYYDRTEYTLSFQVYGYTYTEATNNNSTQYGIYDGEYVQVYYNDGKWYRTRTYSWWGYQYSDPYDGTRYTRSNWESWQTVKAITALYGQNISNNFPIVGTNGITYDNGERWDPQSNNQGWSEVMVFIEIMPAESINFHLDVAKRPLKTMYYYVEALPTDTDNIVTRNGTRYVLYNTISARYNGVTEEDFVELSGFTKDAAAATVTGNALTPKKFNGLDGKYYIANTTQDQSIYFFYSRNSYEINYLDGIYVDGNGNPIEEDKAPSWGTSENILYQADISSYNKGGENYNLPKKAGYVFDGWYLDDACTQPCTFTTMPTDGITVYAKWRQIQYRVFLHPNAGTDPTLDWGSADQEMTFRVPLGGKVSTPDGTRNEYKFIGWYMDEDFTQVFNGDAYVLNESTVTTPYDKTVDMTDPMDKWGNGATTNADVGREWITKKLDLYARWSAELIGADGIGIIYNPNGGTNAPSDTTLYIDTAKAIAQAAPTAPAGKQFDHWILQKWNESSNSYVDTAITVEPGGDFTVLKADARREAKPDHTEDNPSYSYTIQLKAVYIDKECSTPTHITWYSNLKDTDGAGLPLDKFNHEGISNNDPAKGWYVTDKSDGTLQINEAISIRSANTYEYPGYTFLGWAKNQDAADEDDLFLKWDADNSKFQAKNASGTWVDVTQVAADDRDSINDLYAVWEAKYFYVYHSSTGKLEAIHMSEVDSSGTYDLTKKVTKEPKESLYGGWYTACGGVTTDKVEAAKAGAIASADKQVAVEDAVIYDGSSLKNGSTRFWAKANAGNTIGTAVKPSANEVFYLKEVPICYLKTNAKWVYDWSNNNKIEKLYLLTGIDESLYTEVGFVVIQKDEAGKVASTFSYQRRNDEAATKIKATDLIGQRGYLGIVDGSSYINSILQGAVVVKPYWKTLDGVKVATDGYILSCNEENATVLTNDNIHYEAK